MAVFWVVAPCSLVQDYDVSEVLMPTSYGQSHINTVRNFAPRPRRGEGGIFILAKRLLASLEELRSVLLDWRCTCSLPIPFSLFGRSKRKNQIENYKHKQLGPLGYNTQQETRRQDPYNDVCVCSHWNNSASPQNERQCIRHLQNNNNNNNNRYLIHCIQA
jgi:hypothetical protein